MKIIFETLKSESFPILSTIGLKDSLFRIVFLFKIIEPKSTVFHILFSISFMYSGKKEWKKRQITLFFSTRIEFVKSDSESSKSTDPGKKEWKKRQITLFFSTRIEL